MNKKIKAFTISEMIVIMTLTAITVSAAFALYRISNHQWIQYRTAMDKVYTFVLLERQLTQDLQLCQTARINGQTITCNWPDKNVAYHLQDSLIIRTGIVSDTFFTGTAQVEAYWESHAVANDEALLDKIQLRLFPADDTIEYTVYKHYASDILFRTAN